MYLKGERSQGHEKRPSGMSIFEYVIKFESCILRVKYFHMEIVYGVLA